MSSDRGDFLRRAPRVVALLGPGLALESAGDWVDAVQGRLQRLDSIDAALETVRTWRRETRLRRNPG